MPYVMRGWSVTQQRLGIIAFHKLFGLKYLCELLSHNFEIQGYFACSSGQR